MMRRRYALGLCRGENCGLYSMLLAQNPQALDQLAGLSFGPKSVFDGISAGGFTNQEGGLSSRRRYRGFNGAAGLAALIGSSLSYGPSDPKMMQSLMQQPQRQIINRDRQPVGAVFKAWATASLQLQRPQRLSLRKHWEVANMGMFDALNGGPEQPSVLLKSVPTNSRRLQARKSMWQQVFDKMSSDPNLQRAVMMGGLQMMQNTGGTSGTRIAGGIGTGMQACSAGQMAQSQQAQQAEDAAMKRETRYDHAARRVCA